MRISFPNKEHEDTLIGTGDTSIGSAADNTIVVADCGVAAHHVRLDFSSVTRGVELHVADAQARTHLNTRPVREKAMLRMGDVVSLDAVQFVLKPDRDADIRTNIPIALPASAFAARRHRPPRALLRGWSGTLFGKIVPLPSRLVIGSGTEVDLALDDAGVASQHAALEWNGNKLLLRGLQPDSLTQVNGVALCDAWLQDGDQVVFGGSRFVVEAPALSAQAAREHSTPIPHVSPPIDVTSPPAPTPSRAEAAQARPGAASKNDIWWLIGVASLIAAGLALLLML